MWYRYDHILSLSRFMSPVICFLLSFSLSSSNATLDTLHVLFTYYSVDARVLCSVQGFIKIFLSYILNNNETTLVWNQLLWKCKIKIYISLNLMVIVKCKTDMHNENKKKNRPVKLSIFNIHRSLKKFMQNRFVR
jgi:hypothetical protein